MSRRKPNPSPSLPNRKRLEALYARHRRTHEVALRRITQTARKAVARRGLNAHVTGRIKEFDSLFQKLLRVQNQKGQRAAVTDVIGVRVICPFRDDLSEAEAALREVFSVVESERKGSDRSFREFAYDSIHLLVAVPTDWLPRTLPHSRRVCEIQLRTTLQDAWAEVEHEIIYKSGASLLTEPIKRKLASLNAMLNLSDTLFQEIRHAQKSIQEYDDRRKERLREKIVAVSERALIESVEAPGAPVLDFTGAWSGRGTKALESLLFQALEAHGNHRLDDAITIYSRILRLKVHDRVRRVVLLHRGMAEFALSHYAAAARDFTKAIHIDRSDPRAFLGRGLAQRMLGNHRDALDDLQASLELSPYQMEAHYVRALTWYDLGDYVRALDDCERALKVSPDFLPAQRLRQSASIRVLK